MISEFPLFMFTTLAGIAAGAYAMNAIVPLDSHRTRPWLFGLVCLVLLGVGCLGLLFHLGHPERVFNAFRNPAAGITQEGFAAVLFGLAVLADVTIAAKGGKPVRWLQIVAAVLGVALTVAMGFAYFVTVGTPAWANPAVVPFFVAGNLAMGAGFYLLFNRAALASGVFTVYHVVVEVVTAISLAVLAAHFAACGYTGMPFIVAVVVAPVATVVLNLVGRKNGSPIMAYALFACALVGVAVARYAFYAASVI